MASVFSKMSTRNFFILLILVFILLPSVATTYLAYNYTIKTTTDDYAVDHNKSIFTSLEGNIAVISERLNSIALNMLNYPELSNAINNENISYEERKKITDYVFRDIIAFDSTIPSIEFINATGEIYKHGNPLLNSKATDEKFISSLDNYTLFINTDCIKDSNGEYYCAIGKKIYNYATGYELGSIIFYVDTSVFIPNSVPKDSSEDLFFTSADGMIIAHPEKKYINTIFYLPKELTDQHNSNNTGSTYITTHSINNSSIRNHIEITSLTSNKLLFATANRIIILFVTNFLLMSLIGIIIAITMSKRFSLELTSVKNNVEGFANDYTKVSPPNSDNEFVLLETSFYKMATKIQNLIKDITTSKEKQRIAEITALQSQINPHFIYNAIDAISWKAKENGEKEIDDMLIKLATYFRMGLHNGENIVKISDELKHVKSYIAIETYRFPDLFEVNFNIDDNLLDKDIMKIILQPIVENSIKHGFSDIDEGGIIDINGYCENEYIIFTIEDNGKGIENLKDGELPKSSSQKGGYGLYNINSRLKIYYGEKAKIEFYSAHEKGTKVRISIPYNN